MKIKKLFLILMLFIAINLCCWKVETDEVIDQKAYCVTSEDQDLVATSGSFFPFGQLRIIRTHSGREGIFIYWGSFPEVRGMIEVQCDKRDPYKVYFYSDNNCSVTDLDYDVDCLIFDFKRSDIVTFFINNCEDGSTGIKMSLRGFTKAYNKMLSKWRKDN